MARSLLTLIAPLFLSVVFVLARAPSGPWDAFNYAPKTRVVSPIAVHTVQGEVRDPGSLIRDGLGSATLTGNASWVTVDFGKEVSMYLGVTALLILNLEVGWGSNFAYVHENIKYFVHLIVIYRITYVH